MSTPILAISEFTGYASHLPQISVPGKTRDVSHVLSLSTSFSLTLSPNASSKVREAAAMLLQYFLCCGVDCRRFERRVSFESSGTKMTLTHVRNLQSFLTLFGIRIVNRDFRKGACFNFTRCFQSIHFALL